MAVSPKSDESDARAAQIAALVDELIGMGYAKPALDAEIADPQTGRPLAVAEAFWSDGLQPGQGSPVVLELDPEEADIARLSELGCEVFTSVEPLRGYVQRRNEVASGERQSESVSSLRSPTRYRTNRRRRAVLSTGRFSTSSSDPARSCATTRATLHRRSPRRPSTKRDSADHTRFCPFVSPRSRRGAVR
jgi:hypothetical protein